MFQMTDDVFSTFNQGRVSPTTLKLLALLLDWVLDGQVFLTAARTQVKGVDQRVPPEVGLNERCLKVECSLQLDFDVWILVELYPISQFSFRSDQIKVMSYLWFLRFCPY